MAQYHRLAVVNILSFKSFISESCPLFLELLSFKSFETECDACVNVKISLGAIFESQSQCVACKR